MTSEGLKEGPCGRVVVDKVRVAPAAVVAGGKQNPAYAETFRASTFHSLQPLWKESLFPWVERMSVIRPTWGTAPCLMVSGEWDLLIGYL